MSPVEICRDARLLKFPQSRKEAMLQRCVDEDERVSSFAVYEYEEMFSMFECETVTSNEMFVFSVDFCSSCCAMILPALFCGIFKTVIIIYICRYIIL